ncbi:four-carbon acid sugar kinase family protein, partial [Klebsiella pneumoniae]|uniref:four-carbon acid sugar kinase family protein n=1 Tax=Klebsiella pneumoniae TaxID=573 RepID=UPI00272F73E0
AHGCRRGVVARAYPAAGRHTGDGRCYVLGGPLDHTEFASDPKTPVSRAENSEINAMQSRLPCLTLNARQLPAALATEGEE